MYINWKEKIDEKELNIISKLIHDGEIIIFPTETVYGIGANAFDEKAVKKIFEVKGRPQDNPLIVHVSKKEQIYEITKNINEIEEKLIDSFMPGPFTLVLEKKDNVPNIVSAGLDTIGVRMPENEIAKSIIENSKVPIVAPSANISGKPSGTNIEDIKEELEYKVSAIIDGGETKIGIESTVVKVIDNIPVILRPGKITPNDIKNVVGNVKISEKIFKEAKENEEVESPGMKYRHYAPKTPCRVLYSENENKQIELLNEQIKINDENTIVLAFEEHINKINIDKNKILSIGSNKDLNTVMKNLFSALRNADKKNVKIILIEGTKKEDLGLAIMNRLLRACEYDYVEK